MKWLLDILRKWICPPIKEEIAIPKPAIQRLGLTGSKITDELKTNNIKLLRLLDEETDYYFTTHEDWGEIFGWIYQTQELPKYSVDVEGKWNLDCEDWAIWLKAMVSLHFGFNYFGLVIGRIPLWYGGRGYHGFNLLRDEDGLKLSEPNPGFSYSNEPFELFGHGYIAEEILV